MSYRATSPILSLQMSPSDSDSFLLTFLKDPNFGSPLSSGSGFFETTSLLPFRGLYAFLFLFQTSCFLSHACFFPPINFDLFF